MEDLHRIDVKVFATSGNDIDPYTFMTVLQRWIQEHTIPGVLIDVADYSHIHHGPGFILIAHEHNVSIDYDGGKMGLLFRQKTPVDGTLGDRIRSATLFALKAAHLLQAEPDFAGRLAFDLRHALVIANDRLNAPATSATLERLKADAVASLANVYPGAIAIDPVSGDRRSRAAIEVRAANAPNGELLAVG